MAEALVNPSVLLWARARAKMEPDTLAEKTNVKTDKLLLWEEGTTRPTFKQAQDLARALRIPFGFLFLSSPPKETLPIPDLRTLKDRVAAWLSPDLRDVLTDVLRKQDWYRDYRLEQGAMPLPFIGRFGIELPVSSIATNLADTIKLAPSDRQGARNWEGFLDLLMDRAEGAGVCVMRSGIVGDNTHRVLDADEFRGFAVCDDIAPVVFINGADSKAAQIFTLVHELAHLWIGQSGISDPSLAELSSDVHDTTEKYCNAVAAEVLLPERAIRTQWNAQESLQGNASRLANHFRVSTVMVARRAYDVGFIQWPVYIDFYHQQETLWKKRRDNASTGGNYYLNVPIRNGRSLTSAVVLSALEHRLLFRDAGKLLGISPSKIDMLATKMGIG
jgi:Zn-dependent peptidase ImmA (M78 family)/DNA-binding XRE family transcriptional regulator